ncbi:type III secretion system HrpP C-terminal domain-containing protein [Samsonia erythrinae]|uniref:Type III secretion protein HrpP n=1 Tax=Samsonia erythrinae TaxID=160434 RepID=A0A4R3VNR7_9GAMM|nr:type III secretion system HrpP C-terminal domain-containing protein [Samsonia erythrinae]TCV05774.1 hypothetical protein EDC54_10540 [Samsonia erythrinae]
MNNRQIASSDPKTAQNTLVAQQGKSLRADDPQSMDFWEAFTFSDGFEDAFYQEAPAALPLNGSANVVLPQYSETTDSSQTVTPPAWGPLQCELIEAMDNICAPPFSFSLQLPQLGDIDARLAHLMPRGWDITLRFSRESYHQLKDRREACRRSLASALDCPINLRFDAREDHR